MQPDLATRLAILQKTDPLRKWSSLDDTRVCVLCCKTITGRQIIFHPTNGSYRCPTPGCPASVRDWFYLGSGPATGNRGIQKVEADFLPDEREAAREER